MNIMVTVTCSTTSRVRDDSLRSPVCFLEQYPSSATFLIILCCHFQVSQINYYTVTKASLITDITVTVRRTDGTHSRTQKQKTIADRGAKILQSRFRRQEWLGLNKTASDVRRSWTLAWLLSNVLDNRKMH
ncbi:hypothetical protein CEXT_157481 [Caerostris extrusa]|uniref:Uncharacterized protein n=1 Tax=Caerostris extrusa TaxID=172846 RepID=A0AAV4UUY5_CAEEX|nr:hypothetical protein CEXT_157481 [Caerostris extrusa]